MKLWLGTAGMLQPLFRPKLNITLGNSLALRQILCNEFKIQKCHIYRSGASGHVSGV